MLVKKQGGVIFLKISNSMLEWFYYTLLQKTASEYRGYTLKFISRTKEYRLLKNNKKLACWFLETNELKTYDNEKSPAEKKIVKQFILIPQEVENMHQRLKRQREEEIKKEEKRKEEIHNRFMDELNNRCSRFKDEEVTIEHIEQLINSMAAIYIDEWYVVGIHPDRYDDNFPMYFSVARTKVRLALVHVNDERIRQFVTREIDIGSQKGEAVLIDELSEEELIEKTHIILIHAQREGNLVTITELENKRFEKLAEGAIQYAKIIMSENIREFIPNKRIEIYWWEKEGQYFVPSIEEKKEHSSLREMILKQLEPKPKAVAKPSRIEVETRFLTDEKDNETHKYHPKKGVIYWRSDLKK
jgi:uncharacterized protein (UPF0305 family)